MLTKVMKYECKSVGRMLLPLFILALALAAFTRLLAFLAPFVWQPASVFFTHFGAAAGILLFAGVFAAALIYVVVRFWQGMMAQEASLTFSLPVKAGAHIWGRFWVHTLFTLLAFLVSLACLVIAVPGFWGALLQMPLSLHYFGESASFNLAWPGGAGLSLLGCLCVIMLFSLMTTLFKFYAAFAIGSQMRERLLGSFIGFVVLNVAEGLLVLPALLIPLFSIGRSIGDLERFFQSLTASGVLGFFWAATGLIVLFSLLFTVVHAVITRICYGKRLNVE